MFVLVYHFLLCFVVYCCINHSISVFYLCTVSKIVKYKKGCTRLAVASDKVYQLLAHGRWFSPGSPASSTTKTGRHDIAEILLKVALNTKNQSISFQNHLKLELHMIDSDLVQSLIDVHSSNRRPLMSLSQITVQFKDILKSASFPNSHIYWRPVYTI